MTWTPRQSIQATACPLLLLPPLRILSQDELVAPSLANYLARHPEMESRLSRGGDCCYLTTDQCRHFDHLAEIFMGHPVSSQKVELSHE